MDTWEALLPISMQLEHKRGAWKITKGDSMIQKHALLVGVFSVFSPKLLGCQILIYDYCKNIRSQILKEEGNIC